jgi:eukaryotic-like serine/threonine-protein kinase
MPIFTPTPTLTFTPAVSPTPTPDVGSTMISEKDGMTLVYVPAGEFTMGRNGGNPDESPIHTVYLDAFWIDQTEVTNAMYAKCVSAGACKQPMDTRSFTHSHYYGNSEFDNYPVIYVNWNMAKAYCGWAGRQLPTEAQWEKTARGTNGNIYPWGNDFDGTKLNFCDSTCRNQHNNKSFNDGYTDVSPVGNYPSGQSFYGAYDMAGNVFEWVNDWYSETYYQRSPASNPLGPDSGQFRVSRGGSWGCTMNVLRTTYRFRFRGVGQDLANAYDSLGFRCSRSLP